MKAMNFLLLIYVVILFGSCHEARLVFDNGDRNMRIRHFENTNPDSKSKLTKYYVRVDSSSIQFYYSFFPDKIYKTSKIYGKKAREFVFGESHPKYALTQMDSAVFKTTDSIIDSSVQKFIKKSTGVTGLREASENLQ
jgi:hypothetical protein